MSSLFNTLLYQPLFNGLILLYDYAAWKDLGIAIVLLTVLIRLILFPLFYKSFKNQTIMQKIQPALSQIQHEHKDDKETQAKKMMELYREHRINPFSSFLLILVQLPVLIALYQVFIGGISDAALTGLYSFVPNPGTLNRLFLGLLDLQQKSIMIVILAALLQYFQTKLSLPKTAPESNDAAASIGRNMAIIGPVLTVVILGSLPSAVGLYWMVSSGFSLVQQWFVNKKVYG